MNQAPSISKPVTQKLPVAAPHRRTRYQGLIQVFRFNSSHYLSALLIGMVGFGADKFFAFPEPIQFFGLLTLLLIGFWTVASLLVSHWIYDRSKLYQWHWIHALFPHPPIHWVNLHAGFDETSNALLAEFSGTQPHLWDFFDPQMMTEPSILRARKLNDPGLPALRVDCSHLPSKTDMFDVACLIFAAHEIRQRGARERFFNELFRIIKPGGFLLLVEHSRDLANFVAFGPGAFHFFPNTEWIRLARLNHFEVEKQFCITPFVQVYLLQKPL